MVSQGSMGPAEGTETSRWENMGRRPRYRPVPEAKRGMSGSI